MSSSSGNDNEDYLDGDASDYEPSMGKLPRTIRMAFDVGEFFGNVVWGPLGNGKSRYMIRTIGEVCVPNDELVWGVDPDDDEEKLMVAWPDWDAWKDWLVFMPEDFLAKLNFVEQKGRQYPILVWDDAGVWASNQRWAEDFSKSVTQYINVMRSDFASITLTTPNPEWLLKGFRTLPGGHTTRVNKETGNEYQLWKRRARCYETWTAPDFRHHGVKAILEDEFSIKMPKRTSEEYNAVRRKYATEMKRRLEDTYNQMKEEGKKKKAKKWRDDLDRSTGMKIEDDEEKTN